MKDVFYLDDTKNAARAVSRIFRALIYEYEKNNETLKV
jgi:hypothetical protein